MGRSARCPTRSRKANWDKAAADSKRAVEDAAKRLNVTREATLPPEFEALAEARTIINPFERARALAHEWSTNAHLISPYAISLALGTFLITKYMLKVSPFIPAPLIAIAATRVMRTRYTIWCTATCPCCYGL